MSKLSINISAFEAVIFDVDGVLSQITIPMGSDGVPQRTLNVRDGYAIKMAIEKGITLGIISGGYSEALPKRYEGLGMKHIYMGIPYKIEALRDFIQKTGIPAERIIYVGDDLPDIEVMKYCGFCVAPADAAPEVKAIANYISPVSGGMGVARDILEELLKVKNLWMNETAFGW
ncbi:HAD family hydrolase [Porphyromonas sp.]|uniref:KdsC family phosphatase n=1 Tax=Porphyromonas sp. TaxID=1924944 RepID=UPI0026DC20EC|nr:HAD hydrolase family protein [Porphyromonas sp.]MDO4771840.1 HAD hydrolase family protein [Porphyromonas sp.]